MELLVFFALVAAGVWIVKRGKRGGGQEGRTHHRSDAFDGDMWDVSSAAAVEAVLQIKYTDVQNNRTTRTVDVRQFGQTAIGHWLMSGNCRLRRERRTFRIDRISYCVDMETGEVIERPIDFLHAKFAADPKRAQERLQEAELDAMKVLFYLGKADGQLRAAEAAIIRRTAHSLVSDSQLTDEMVDRVLRDLGTPSMQAFKLAVGRLGKREAAIKAVLLDAARSMVATQKTVAAAEAEALAYIEKRLA